MTVPAPSIPRLLVIGPNPRATLIRAAAIAGAAAIVFGWILLPLRLSGISMSPTYSDGALNFANRAAYWFREPSRGDVVAIRMAGARAVYVKRVVGMPGERIEIVQGTVVVNGRRSSNLGLAAARAGTSLLSPSAPTNALWSAITDR